MRALGRVSERRRADATRELHADYAASKAYRALFNASISEACGEGRNEIDHFITGLPVSQMRQPQLVERLTAQLTGTHQVVPSARSGSQSIGTASAGRDAELHLQHLRGLMRRHPGP